METLTQLFQSRVAAFLERTGLKPSTFGLLATGDPNLIRQLHRGRSPTLALADRILAFMDAYDQARADHVSSGCRPPGDASFGTRRERVVARAVEQEMLASARILRLPGVQSRTGLSRATIYARVAAGSFPAPVQAVGWVEAEVDAWIRQQIAASRGEAQ